jgi:hypothetical protein
MRDHPLMRIARLITGLAALAVCAWFAIGVRQVNDTRSATRILAAGKRGQLVRATGLISVASLLNPDRTLDLLRVQVALGEGRSVQARRLAHRLVQAEPMNVAAWLWYGRTANGDAGVFLTALAQARKLDPLPLGR